MKTLRFTALDTWFFRESRPMEALGGSELASVFPPPPRTLLGAVRTAIGDAQGVDWRAFAQEAGHPLRALIGHGDDLGPLTLSGPWLHHQGERLYPVPALLLHKDGDFKRLRIGAPARTSLGRVRLPELPQGAQGYKPPEGHWITAAGFTQLLRGGLPDPTELCARKALFQEEPRLGIALDHHLRTTQEGLLYQTRHLRPKPDLAVDMEIGLAEGVSVPSGLVRLGGEGRMAHLETVATPELPEAPKVDAKTQGLMLALLTPLRAGPGRDGWLPPGFLPQDIDGVRIWRGEIAGIPLTIHAAILGKAQREGGWDMANHRPRPMQSLIPAGGLYYASVDGDPTRAIASLHGARIGSDEDRALGRGLIACALWQNDER